MMNTLITPQQVVDIAFAGSFYLSPQSIGSADIVAATARYVEPIAGRALIDALAEGKYAELLESYVVPALAFAVRALVQPALALRMGEGGLAAPRTESSTAPTSEATRALQRSVTKRARQHLHRLSDHLNNNASLYAEYDPKLNILNRCSIDGGLVQTF